MQASYKQSAKLRESSFGTVTDTPELLHAAYLKDVYSQVLASGGEEERNGGVEIEGDARRALQYTCVFVL